jgi:hypothetical protein
MTFYEYADVLNVDIRVIRYHNQNDRWSARFQDCEVKDGAVLRTTSGEGKTPELAISDYIKQIRGKRIIFNAYTDNRREFTVPDIAGFVPGSA